MVNEYLQSNQAFVVKHASWIILLSILLSRGAYGQKTSTGLVPINDLATGEYKGFLGGLYPNGSNARPWKHDSLGMVFSRAIAPLDTSGEKDTINGKIVFLSIGMSNTTQEFSVFRQTADTFKLRNPRLVIIDGAVGGQTAAIISDPARNQTYWKTVDQRLQSAGVNPKQVQVCWVKEADSNPSQPFPMHANALSNELAGIAKIIKQRFPNVQMAYWSSRTYGGYATTSLNPEPYAYESGFAVKWLIQKQIDGDTAFSCTGQTPKSPWLAWGPYLWADGLVPRSDGLTWSVDDFSTTDGTHPSTSGRKKVANLLLDFFKKDSTAKSWFLKSTSTLVRSPDFSDTPQSFRLYPNHPNPFNDATQIEFQIQLPGQIVMKLFDSTGKEVMKILDQRMDSGVFRVSLNGGNLPSGVYICQLSGYDCVQSTKCILIK